MTDESVTSHGGAGETISLPPKTSHVPHPTKCKMSTWKKCKNPSKLKRSNYAFNNSEEQIQNLNIVVYPHMRFWKSFVSDDAAMSPKREERHVELFLYAETMESGRNSSLAKRTDSTPKNENGN